MDAEHVETAERLTEEQLASLVLENGNHDDRAEGVCFMEAAAWFAGEPHSDQPACVCPVLAAFGRAFNDGIKDDARRTALLVPYVARVIQTKADRFVEERRAFLAMDWLIREHTPAWLDLMIAVVKDAA